MPTPVPAAVAPPAPGDGGGDAAVSPFYSVRNIASSARSFGWGELERSAASVYKSPCFRQALLWGAGVGALFAAHRVKQRGSRFRVINDGLLAAALTYVSQWYLCRVDEADRRAALRAHYAQEAPRVSATLAGDVDDEAVDGGEAWRRELERAVTYELPTVEHGSSTGVRLR